MTQRLVSEELLRNMADALKFFASEMTVGQRYTDHGQTALDAPGEIDKLLEQPSSGADWWRLKLPGGRYTDDFESARVGDYNSGWNDYRKAVIALLTAQPAPVQEPDVLVEWQPGGYAFHIVGDVESGDLLYRHPQQPRKAVKLSDDEIRKALGVEYVESAQNRGLFMSDIRAIEQAVWEKLGVQDDQHQSNS